MAKSMTVGQLARQTGLSRSALLYYDRLGLVRPTARSSGDYRLYGESDVERVRQVCLYRQMGVPLKQIAVLLDHRQSDRREQILRKQLESLSVQITALQDMQRQILRLLEQITSLEPAGRRRSRRGERPATSAHRSSRSSTKETNMVNKQRWCEIMRAAGFNDQQMHAWHQQFEAMEPDNHQEFLELLGIDKAEVQKIRHWSRGQ